MKQIVFIQTSRGHRGSMYSDFRIISKDEFVRTKGANRYAYIGHSARHLKDMSLETFEAEFTSKEFTSKEVTSLFRKEISEKYGDHAIRKRIKKLRKSELEVGSLYLDVDGKRTWLFLGEATRTNSRVLKYNKKYNTTETKTGLLWIECRKHQSLNLYVQKQRRNSVIRHASLIKGIKSVQSKINTSVNHDLNHTSTYTVTSNVMNETNTFIHYQLNL